MFDSRSYRKPLEREISRQLRHEGWSYKKIAAELDVSVSSVYAWTNHIALTEEQIAFNLGKGIPADSETVNRRARTWVAKNRARREEFQEAGRSQARKSNAVCTLRVKRSTWLVQHIYGAIQEYGDFEEPAWLG